MKTLIDYKNQAQQLCSRSVQIVEKAGFSEDSEKLKAFTDEVLSKTSPQLAFYGTYGDVAEECARQKLVVADLMFWE